MLLGALTGCGLAVAEEPQGSTVTGEASQALKRAPVQCGDSDQGYFTCEDSDCCWNSETGYYCC